MTGVVSATDAVPDQTLVEIVGDVFESLLGEQNGRPFRVPHNDPSTPVIAEIGIDGGWTGTVTLRLPRALAERITTELFALPAGPVAEGDLRDVIGELVNVIGGNVKALLPGPNSLTLPRTDLDPGTDDDPRALCLQWDGQPFHVSMPAAAPTPTPTAHPVPHLPEGQ